MLQPGLTHGPDLHTTYSSISFIQSLAINRDSDFFRDWIMLRVTHLLNFLE